MTMRSSRIVTFRRPFTLGTAKASFPPGNYRIETGEEFKEGIFFPLFKRRRTVMYLHQEAIDPAYSTVVTIDPSDLDDALRNDQASAGDPENQTPGTRRDSPGTSIRTPFDRKAVDRAEDEGMTLQSAPSK